MFWFIIIIIIVIIIIVIIVIIIIIGYIIIGFIIFSSYSENHCFIIENCDTDSILSCENETINKTSFSYYFFPY